MRHPIGLLVLLTLTTCAGDGAPDTSWLGGTLQQIAAREYHASHDGRGLQAPNRAHALRTRFMPSGIAVHDRVAGTALLELELAAIGRGGELAAVPPGELSSAGTRVEIRRPGVVEWYENSAAGLEQGFTLSVQPGGDGALALELALSGATASQRGDRLTFASAAGRKLDYGHLAAFDASGRTLPTRFELAGPERVRLVVDDSGAAYPVVVDPLFTEAPDAEIESNQVGGQLGMSLAGAGDVDADGYADLIVGAPFFDAGQVDEGAAFLFRGGPDGIEATSLAEAATQLESDQAAAKFGTSVAGAGDVNGDGYADVIVGAPRYAAGTPDEGAAFVFLGGPTGISGTNPASAATRLEADEFAHLGTSVSGAGDVNGDGYADVIVGAPFAYLVPGTGRRGGAFVFVGSASGIANGNPASAATRLQGQFDEFGASVAGAGDVNADGFGDIAVGAPKNDGTGTVGNEDNGAAYVFLGTAAGIPDATSAAAATQIVSDRIAAALGLSVAGAGDVNGDGYADLIVGAPSWGAAFVFHGGPAGIPSGDTTSASATISSSVEYSLLGMSVAGAGDLNGDGYADVIVGAPGYESGCCGGGHNDGAAFISLGDASGISSFGASAQLTIGPVDSQLGWSVASLGDVNGDGYADLAVAAPFLDEGEADEGKVLVFTGSSQSQGFPSGQLFPVQSDAEAGASVAAAGDVNGDGYSDWIVGAPGYDAGSADEGAAFLFLGGATWTDTSFEIETSATARFESDQAGARLGASVASAGDVNGDGYADVIVGAPQYDAGAGAAAGTAFLFHGAATGMPDGNPATAATRLHSDQAGARFGASVAGDVDLNGDGYADVIVGAPDFDAGESDEGAAFVFHGRTAGIADGGPAAATARFESDQESAHLGVVAGAGDVNGDGYADIVVGAPDYDDSLADEGAAFVLHGGTAGISGATPSAASATLVSAQEGAHFGAALASAGDVDGDGYAEVIAGAPEYDTDIPDVGAFPDAGAAFVFHGGAAGVGDGTAAGAETRIWSDVADSKFGFGVDGLGDADGDGYGDVIVVYGTSSDVSGPAFVVTGSADGLGDGAADIDTGLEGIGASVTPSRHSVAGAGDVNGDGYADTVIGEPDHPNFGALVYMPFSSYSGRDARARQRTPAGAPIAPWGGSAQSDGFSVSLQAVHPDGTGLVRAEFEACRAGVAFGDASCATAITPEWVAVAPGASVAVLTHTFTGLDAGALYRWRGRVLRAPATATQPGITLLPASAHGPWRRPQAQTSDADVRVMPEPGLAASLAAGAALLAQLARRRVRN